MRATASEAEQSAAPSLAGPGATRPVPRPSASARHVALARARLPRPHTQDADLTTEARLHAHLARDDSSWNHFLAARTTFVDDELMRVLRSGTEQVVLVGAGYDSRALRFKSAGVRYWEVDLPATQADKLRRLRDLNADTGHVEFVGADLAAQRLSEVLARTTFESAKPAVFLCEGVLLYLPRDAAVTLLADTRACAAAGSTLLVTFAIRHPTTTGSALAPARRDASGELRQTFFTPGGATHYLRAGGWEPERTEHPDQSLTPDADVALFIRAVPSA